ncbi:MAG: hypothetical protein ACRYFX_10755 [Janthinobacterium lividum]
MLNPRYRPYLISIAVGVFYALVARFAFSRDFGGGDNDFLLTVSFLLGTPVALGAVSAHFTAPEASGWWRQLWAPLLNTLLFLAAALVFHLEGMICVLMMAPLFLILGYIGATLYVNFTEDKDDPRDKTLVVGLFAVLPFLAAPIEHQLTTPDTIRRVENSVIINAPAPVVWQHIIRVAPIQPADLGSSLVDKLGFPRPVEATLTHEGVGGVRHATFERGVEFIETVDDWQPQRRLSFSIVANTASIPPTTFDEHVTVGGKFFDVLRGTYELQPAGPGRTRLVLYSQQRLSTNINWYASFWTTYIMSEIQRRILVVLQHRCEAQA